jgi:hypothetical protein
VTHFIHETGDRYIFYRQDQLHRWGEAIATATAGFESRATR